MAEACKAMQLRGLPIRSSSLLSCPFIIILNATPRLVNHFNFDSVDITFELILCRFEYIFEFYILVSPATKKKKKKLQEGTLKQRVYASTETV